MRKKTPDRLTRQFSREHERHIYRHAGEDITAAQVQELLEYDPACGTLRWRMCAANGAKGGKTVGAAGKSRYVMVRVLGKVRPAHRLAWVVAHGAWPTYWIDHINGDKHDNRLANLRDVPAISNARNSPAAKVRALIGARPTAAGLWEAVISEYRTDRVVGVFQTRDEANEAAVKAQLLAGDPHAPRPRVRL